MAQKFAGAERKSVGLPHAYRQVAQDLACFFFDASSCATTSAVDGVHLDADQHVVLGKAMAQQVCAWLPAG
jgi:hypothetical protein